MPGLFRRSLFRLTPGLISVTHEPVLRVSVVVRVSTPAPMGSSMRAISPREGVSITPPHQVPAATPQPEGLDATPSKAIHTTINQNLNAAVPVRTRTPSRPKPRDPHTQRKPRRYSPTTSSDSLPTFRAPSQSTSQKHVQTNDMSQGGAIDQDQLVSAQQARRLGPP